VSGGIDGGGLPRVGAMFEASLGARKTWWRAEGYVLYRLQSSTFTSANPNIGGRFSMWAVGARGCGVPQRRNIEFPLCVGAEGGRVIAEGFGFPQKARTRVPWGAAVLSPGIAFRVRRNLAFVIQGTLGVPFVRTTFRVDGLAPVHTTGPVFGRGVIGFEGRFP
jgi:hypothetical protein